MQLVSVRAKELSYLERSQYGAGGVHKEEPQVTQHICKSKQALGDQNGMEGIPVFPVCVPHIFELESKDESET